MLRKRTLGNKKKSTYTVYSNCNGGSVYFNNNLVGTISSGKLIVELLLKRIFKGPQYTIGKLYINGKYFCDTLEDVVRETKIPNETAIPPGTYKVIVNMSPRFKRLLPRLLNVPGFDGILIHRGNTPSDTSGCILVGENKVKGKVINSTPYEKKLVEILKDENDISITIE